MTYVVHMILCADVDPIGMLVNRIENRSPHGIQAGEHREVELHRPSGVGVVECATVKVAVRLARLSLGGSARAACQACLKNKQLKKMDKSTNKKQKTH